MKVDGQLIKKKVMMSWEKTCERMEKDEELNMVA